MTASNSCSSDGRGGGGGGGTGDSSFSSSCSRGGFKEQRDAFFRAGLRRDLRAGGRAGGACGDGGGRGGASWSTGAGFRAWRLGGGGRGGAGWSTGARSRAWRLGGVDAESAVDAALSLRLVAAPRRRGLAAGGGEGFGSMSKRRSWIVEWSATGVWPEHALLLTV